MDIAVPALRTAGTIKQRQHRSPGARLKTQRGKGEESAMWEDMRHQAQDLRDRNQVLKQMMEFNDKHIRDIEEFLSKNDRMPATAEPGSEDERRATLIKDSKLHQIDCMVILAKEEKNHILQLSDAAWIIHIAGKSKKSGRDLENQLRHTAKNHQDWKIIDQNTAKYAPPPAPGQTPDIFNLGGDEEMAGAA